MPFRWADDLLPATSIIVRPDQRRAERHFPGSREDRFAVRRPPRSTRLPEDLVALGEAVTVGLAGCWKMAWSGVASAAGLDARSRDEGDAGAHRREAATPQTVPRRRNRLRWLASSTTGQPRRPRPFFSRLLKVSAGRDEDLGALGAQARIIQGHPAETRATV